MSIIEETLRTLQTEQDGNGRPVEVEKAPKNIKPRTRPFVMIIIALVILGLGAYMAIDRYQEKLKEKQETLSNEIGYLETEILPLIKIQEASTILEPEAKQGLDMQHAAVKQQSSVISVQQSQQPVLDNRFSDPFKKSVQDKNIGFSKTTGVDDLNQEAEHTPIANAHKVALETSGAVLESDRQKPDDRAGGAEVVVLDQVSSINIAGELEPQYGIDEEKNRKV